MKKLLSVLLAVLLLASLGVTAFAEEGNTEVIEDMGITVTWPSNDELLDYLETYSYGAIARDPNVYYMPVYYYAVPSDIIEKALNGELTEEESAMIDERRGELCNVYVTNDVDALLANTFGVDNMEDLDMTEFGTAEGYSFLYVPVVEEDFVDSIEEDYADEFYALQEACLLALTKADLYAPIDPMGETVGKAFRFETTDLDGNPVTSEELFSRNEITMINYWGTWCGNCVGELAALGDIDRSLQEKGCGIIGIVEDASADDQDSLDKAKGLLMENDVDFPNIVPCDEMGDILDDVDGYPTSFFVDRTGTILCSPISGAAVSQYENTVLDLKNGEEVAFVDKPEAKDNGLKCYRVLVYDLDGNPIKGVTVQFCSDELCNLGKTDAEGVARFDVDEGVEYTVHVFKVPEGYAKDSGEYVTQKVYSDVTLFLEPLSSAYRIRKY